MISPSWWPTLPEPFRLAASWEAPNQRSAPTRLGCCWRARPGTSSISGARPPPKDSPPRPPIGSSGGSTPQWPSGVCGAGLNSCVGSVEANLPRVWWTPTRARPSRPRSLCRPPMLNAGWGSGLAPTRWPRSSAGWDSRWKPRPIRFERPRRITDSISVREWSARPT